MSYSFTQFSTLAKIYTTTAREPSIHLIDRRSLHLNRYFDNVTQSSHGSKTACIFTYKKYANSLTNSFAHSLECKAPKCRSKYTTTGNSTVSLLVNLTPAKNVHFCHKAKSEWVSLSLSNINVKKDPFAAGIKNIRLQLKPFFQTNIFSLKSFCAVSCI